MADTEPLEIVLLKFKTQGSDWERKPTSIPGVYIVRMPPWKNRGPQLALEIQPPGIRKGIFLRNLGQLQAFKFVFNQSDKLLGIFELMNAINGESPQTSTTPE